MSRRLVHISKFVSKVLRHAPGEVGLTLDDAGWVDIDALLAAADRAGVHIDRAELDEVVRTSDKQRFAIDPTGTRIRANQGHSVPVDLGLVPVEPPPVLFHGTVAAALPAIRADGLRPMRRHHVHLSGDEATAIRVGARRGKPVILVVDAAAMRAEGVPFYRSENGVWLVDTVAPRFVKFP